MALTPLEWLVAAHVMGDWILQTEWQSANKAKGKFLNAALMSHCLVYALCFVPVFLLLGISAWWLTLIFWSHAVLDRRRFVVWWLRKVKRISQETIDQAPWLRALTDQMMHVLVLVLIIAFS